MWIDVQCLLMWFSLVDWGQHSIQPLVYKGYIMDNIGKWNSRKEFAWETVAVNSFNEKSHMSYTATAKGIEKKQQWLLQTQQE
jgi:hypothetical protein